MTSPYLFSPSRASSAAETSIAAPTPMTAVHGSLHTGSLASLSSPSPPPQSTLLPSMLRDEQETLLPLGCQRSVVAKSAHQQFPDYEVFLLAFETPQAISTFFAEADAAAVPCPDTGRQYCKLEAGQLVAVCLRGDEDAHALHTPVFGALCADATPLQEKSVYLKDSLTARSPITLQSWPLWRTSIYDYDLRCNTLGQSRDLEELIYCFAELGDAAIRKTLCNRDKSPHLLASEARRMAFGERWLFATFASGQAPPADSIGSTEWEKVADDDTLLPCLSIEWSNARLEEGCRSKVYSKTGYCLELTTKPGAIIVNRNFPHWRSSGVQFVQLVPPNIALTEGNIEGIADHDDVANQLQQYESRLKENGQGLRQHPALCQAIVDQLSSFILHDLAPHVSLTDTLQQSLLAMTTRCKEIISSSEPLWSGIAAVIPSKGQLRELILASLSSLEDNFSLLEEDIKHFESAIGAVMRGKSTGAPVCKQVQDCFLVMYKHALTNTLPLCGRSNNSASMPQFEATIESPFIGQATAAGLEYNTPEGHTSPQNDDGDTTMGTPSVEGDLNLQDDGTSMQSQSASMDLTSEGEDTASSIGNNQRSRRKRLPSGSSESLPTGRAKQPRVSSCASQSRPAPSVPCKGSLAIHGGHLKVAICHILNKEGTGKLDQNELAGDEASCALLIRDCIKNEVEDAKTVPQETAALCQLYSQIEHVAGEKEKALLLMKVVEQVCDVAWKQGDLDQWDWMLLSLAYHANEIVKNMATIAGRAYVLQRYEVGAFDIAIRSFNGPLGDLIKEVKELHENEMTSQRDRQQRSVHPIRIRSDKITPIIGEKLDAANNIQEPEVYLSYIKFRRPSKGNERPVDDSVLRFEAAVFDVLFQTYFKSLTNYLTAINLEGGFDKMDRYRANWAMTRRFLRFRLEVIEKLGSCKTVIESLERCGTAVFAARCCRELVFAPAKYLPLPLEKHEVPFYDIASPYISPKFIVERGTEYKEAELATPQGWNAITSSLEKNIDVILELAKKKDPSHSMLTHFRSPDPESQS